MRVIYIGGDHPHKPCIHTFSWCTDWCPRVLMDFSGRVICPVDIITGREMRYVINPRYSSFFAVINDAL